jgi:hypothetical protein
MVTANALGRRIEALCDFHQPGAVGVIEPDNGGDRVRA